MKLQDKLKKIRLDHHLTMDELAARFKERFGLNLSKSMISKWENGKAEPTNVYLSAYAKYFNVSLDYLIGLSDKMAPIPHYDNASPLKLKGRQTVSVPIYGRIAAGIPIEANEDIDGSIEVDKELVQHGEYFGLKATGDSMYPKIEDGDDLLFEKTSEYRSGDVCAVYVNGYDATVKQVINRGQDVVLQPINPSYQPHEYKKDEISVIGTIKLIQRKFK